MVEGIQILSNISVQPYTKHTKPNEVSKQKKMFDYQTIFDHFWSPKISHLDRTSSKILHRLHVGFQFGNPKKVEPLCFRIMCTTGDLGRYIGPLSTDSRSIYRLRPPIVSLRASSLAVGLRGSFPTPHPQGVRSPARELTRRLTYSTHDPCFQTLVRYSNL